MGQTKICRYCGEVISKDAQYCPFCKKYLYKEPDGANTQVLVCSKCQAIVNTDDNFCQYCGAIYNIPEPSENDGEIIHNINGIHYHIGILFASLAISFCVALLMSTGNKSGIGQLCGIFAGVYVITEILLYIYFLPSIIAIENNHPNIYIIYICNLLFGITIIGWFIVFGMSLQSNPRR